jgi:hypothetical protein
MSQWRLRITPFSELILARFRPTFAWMRKHHIMTALRRNSVTSWATILQSPRTFELGVVEKSAFLREALKALIEREAARRMAELGGASPGMAYIPRRRAKAK